MGHNLRFGLELEETRHHRYGAVSQIDRRAEKTGGYNLPVVTH